MEPFIILNNQLKRISVNCRDKRIELNMSILDLSVAADVSEKTIYIVESGKGNTTIRNLVNISFALNMTIDDLLK